MRYKLIILGDGEPLESAELIVNAASEKIAEAIARGVISDGESWQFLWVDAQLDATEELG